MDSVKYEKNRQQTENLLRIKYNVNSCKIGESTLHPQSLSSTICKLLKISDLLQNVA